MKQFISYSSLCELHFNYVIQAHSCNSIMLTLYVLQQLSGLTNQELLTRNKI